MVTASECRNCHCIQNMGFDRNQNNNNPTEFCGRYIGSTRMGCHPTCWTKPSCQNCNYPVRESQ